MARLTRILAPPEAPRAAPIRRLPILILMAHESCNCRCLMCDIWRGNAAGKALGVDDVKPRLNELARLGVERIVFSGGEPLMNPALWTLCEAMRGQLEARITLLSTGLLLKRHARDIARWVDDVIVSLDGDEEVHDRIRDIPGAFVRLAAGVKALRGLSPAFPISARCVIQKQNYRALARAIDAAKTLGLDSISFLAADLSSKAFNRPGGWDGRRVATVALSADEVVEFDGILDGLAKDHGGDFRAGFIVESPARLRRIAQYYRAHGGHGDFPKVTCNAPWVSAVWEVDGTVRPCFFHRPYGRMTEGGLGDLLNGGTAVAWRKNLVVADNETCRRCICSLNYKDQPGLKFGV